MNEAAAVEKAVADAILDDFPEGFIEGWIMVAEIVDEHGEYWLTRRVPPKMPAWRAKALLQEALDSFNESEEDDG